MRVTALALPGVLLIEPDMFRDARGAFFESWNARATGAGGQLGRALVAAAPAAAALRQTTHAELDIADAGAVAAVMRERAATGALP